MTSSLTTTTKLLHWTVALGILTLIPMGIYMSEFEVYGLFHWHKTLGVLVTVPLVFRAIYRLIQGWPEAAGKYSPIEILASRIVHWCLLVGIMVLPISGLMYSGLGGYGVPVFNWELIPSNYVSGEAVAYSAYWSDIGKQIHSISGWILAAIITLHIAGALKHHLVDKDNTLTRMIRS